MPMAKTFILIPTYETKKRESFWFPPEPEQVLSCYYLNFTLNPMVASIVSRNQVIAPQFQTDLSKRHVGNLAGRKTSVRTDVIRFWRIEKSSLRMKFTRKDKKQSFSHFFSRQNDILHLTRRPISNTPSVPHLFVFLDVCAQIKGCVKFQRMVQVYFNI